MPSTRTAREAMGCFLRIRAPVSALVFTLFMAVACSQAFGNGIGPTVKEVVEFTRILQPLGHDNDTLQTQISPDGERAFVVTRQSRVASDENRFDILLLDVRKARLASGKAVAPIRLLRISSKRDASDADPPLQSARWAGDGVIVFRARLGAGAFQVYRLDVATHRVRPLTADPHGVMEFAVSDNLRRVVYLAAVPHPATAEGARSLVVGTHSFWSVHFPQKDTSTQQRRYRWLVADARSPNSARPLGETFDESSNGWPMASISPDGRWAVLPRYEPARQVEWVGRYPSVAEATTTSGPSATQDPLSYYSRPHSYVPRRQVAYRLSDGLPKTIVDAPDDSRPGGGQLRSDRLWMRDSRSVVIAGTYLQNGGADSAADQAAHLIEYFPEEGRWTHIARVKRRIVNAVPVTGRSNAFVAVDGDERRQFERSVDGTWSEVKATESNTLREGWSLRVGEALNRPPDVVAFGPGGRTLRLTELNPQFSTKRWGTMRPYAWKDEKGRPWEGGLMAPADFDPAVRHALVIQTYGFSPTRFYRDGSNIYDGFTSGFPGRAFMREDILVLALPWSAASGAPSDAQGAFAAFGDGVRGAIDALVADGSVDRDRVGIMGWSATGERVLNLVTFSDAPIRAASLLDGDANTLFSMTITYAVKDGIQAGKERTNGGGPFGGTLDRWARRDPSLHTDCVKAALRIETYGPEVHNNWDIYALLRRQYKAVELIVMPQGSHALSRPSERMISLQGNVDWYRFWLNGEQRSEPVVPGETPTTLGEQYVRWRQMESLQRAADTKPVCVRPPVGE